MKIVFCLPAITSRASGGYKIVFEYANRLQKRGHDIDLVFLTDYYDHFFLPTLWLKKQFGRIRLIGFPKWFPLDPKINRIATSYRDGRDFPDADIVIATEVGTAHTVAELSPLKGKKFYFIQGFENWLLSEEEVINTYKLGMRNITIASWLEQLVKEKSGANAITVSNPIDISKFYVKTPIDGRNPFEIGMLYHHQEHKGVPIALEALDIVREVYPQLRLNLFGVPDNPNLGDWVTYTQAANDKQLLDIYNKSAIFVCASIEEGFGLTGAESMACGCALVSTSYRGVFEYAENGVNALLSPVNNVETLAANIIELIRNQELRIKLAKNGSEKLKSMDWESAVDKLVEAFEENICENF